MKSRKKKQFKMLPCTLWIEICEPLLLPPMLATGECPFCFPLLKQQNIIPKSIF